MLTVRPDQIKVFEDALREDFEERLFNHLRQSLPEGRSEVWLQGQITRGIREASDCDIHSERDIAAFVEATCAALGGFPEGPLPRQALAILRSYGADARVKIERYRTWAVESKTPADESAA
ncbi:MAG TPA: hypothetical protein VGL53_18935 [Bryobacteraceae bacterium]